MIKLINTIKNNDYSFNIINKFYTILIGVVSSAMLTRYLGVNYRGDYSYIIQISSIIATIINLGMNQSYSYFYKRNNGNIFNKFIDIYSLQFIVNIIFFSILGFFLDNNIYIYALILIPFTSILQQMESCVSVENIRLKIKMHIVNVTLKFILYVGMLFFLSRSLLIPVIIMVLVNSTIVYVYAIKLNVKPRPFNIDFKFLSNVIRYSWVPMVISLLTMLNYSLDIILLQHLGTDTHLGLYAVAIGIINYIWLIPDAFKEVLVSRVARTSSVNSTILALKASTYTVIAVIIFFIIFGKPALFILYGSEYLGAYPVTVIISIGAVFMVFFKIIGVTMLADGKRWVFFFTLLISVLSNLILNFYTIPIYGMYGAAISTVITYSFSGIFFLIYFAKYNKINFFNLILLSKKELKIINDIIFRRRQ